MSCACLCPKICIFIFYSLFMMLHILIFLLPLEILETRLKCLGFCPGESQGYPYSHQNWGWALIKDPNIVCLDLDGHWYYALHDGGLNASLMEQTCRSWHCGIVLFLVLHVTSIRLGIVSMYVCINEKKRV